MAKKRTTKDAKGTKGSKPSTLDPGPSTLDPRPSILNYPWIAPELQHLAVPIDRLELDPKNAKKHDEANIRAVQRSLRREGQYHPLLIDGNTMEVVIGNCRLIAARRLKWTHVAAIVKPLTPTERARLGIQDNRTGELGDWDLDLLDLAVDTIAEENADQADLLRWQLALDDLERSTRRKKDRDGTEPQFEGLEYRIIILCEGEEHQAALLTRLEREGLNCQALIS